jgi:hypothetical protein
VARDRHAATLVALLVVSHWLLDAVAHRPDLALVPGGAVRVGFGLWNAPPASVVAELGLFAGGVLLYLRATPGQKRWPLGALCVLLLAIFAADLLGPPPPSITAVAVAGLAQWLLVAAGWWVDRPGVPRRAMALPAR